MAAPYRCAIPYSRPRLLCFALPWQAAICFGYVTPLFFAYFIEARHKLRFAVRHGLLRENEAGEGWPLRGMFHGPPSGCVAEDILVVPLAYANLLFLTNMAVVAVVLYAPLGLV